VYKVFLLTGAGDPETVILERPIRNDATDASGRTTAWVQMQRYASLAALAEGAPHVQAERGSLTRSSDWSPRIVDACLLSMQPGGRR
jgi:hypothetical protein